MAVLEELIETFSETSDVGIEQRFGTRSSEPLIIIGAIYLLIVLKVGPSFMKSRPPFQLKTFIVLYNIFQVVICTYLVRKIYTMNLPILQIWECVDIIPGTKTEKEFNHISICLFWLKVSELSETIVFVLRKKNRQVSFLHVFHHCATLYLVYHLKIYKASPGLLPPFLNSIVHIFMYCYYLTAAIVPANIVAKLTPVKKAITTIQMVQFFLILTQASIVYSRGCSIPTTIFSIYILIICAFFYMFYDFYQKNYSAKRHLTTDEKKIHETNKAA